MEFEGGIGRGHQPWCKAAASVFETGLPRRVRLKYLPYKAALKPLFGPLVSTVVAMRMSREFPLTGLVTAAARANVFNFVAQGDDEDPLSICFVVTDAQLFADRIVPINRSS